MMENFKFGELVEVRDYGGQRWLKRAYVGTMPHCKFHWAMCIGQNQENFDGEPFPYSQIRKIQN
jgi:hypothetical protein